MWIFDALGRRHGERAFDAAGQATSAVNRHHDGEHVAHEETLEAGAVVAARWYTHSDLTDDIVALTGTAGAGAVSPVSPASGPLAPADGGGYYHTDQ